MKQHYIRARTWVYRILDRVTRNRGIGITVNHTRLRVPAPYMRYFPASYELDNFLFFQNSVKPGMTCMDIGAHIGLYSVLMAKISNGRIYSFEPTPVMFSILERTIRLNHLEKNIIPVCKAIDARSGHAIFHINHTRHPGIESARIAEGNSLQYFEFGKHIVKEKKEVETITIDDFRKANQLKIDFIKIDAEGSEYAILLGAVQIFKEDRPAGILGIHAFT